MSDMAFVLLYDNNAFEQLSRAREWHRPNSHSAASFLI